MGAVDAEAFMAEELDLSNPEHAAGVTMAAFSLAQMCLSSLVKNELIQKGEAERMLKKLIKANEGGGTPDQVAATMLTAVLQDVSAFRPATRQ
jgi:glycerol dehydrogenase-like iron-containing ADH family enzyme